MPCVNHSHFILLWLYFHVAESGKKSTWRYRFRVDGKESICVLGEYPDMSLEQARKARMERQQERWSGSHAKAVLGTLERDAFPSLGACPVDAVTPPMVLELIRSIENRGAIKCYNG